MKSVTTFRFTRSTSLIKISEIRRKRDKTYLIKTKDRTNRGVQKIYFKKHDSWKISIYRKRDLKQNFLIKRDSRVSFEIQRTYPHRGRKNHINSILKKL